MAIDQRVPFEESDIYKHESLTFAHRVRSIMSANPFDYPRVSPDEPVMLKWLNELLPAVDSYRATLRILKSAYERGEL